MKKIISISISEYLVQTMKERSINVSKFAENAIREKLYRESILNDGSWLNESPKKKRDEEKHATDEDVDRAFKELGLQ